MSRFADPAVVETVDFGECLCPGAPHDSDWAKLPGELTLSQIRRAMLLTNLDDDDAVAAGLAPFVIEWNLLGPNGEPWPPSAESIAALKVATLTGLITGLAHVVETSSALPNDSSAPSAESSRESASPTRKRNRTPGT